MIMSGVLVDRVGGGGGCMDREWICICHFLTRVRKK
jgi:hypothetical protein